MKDEKTVGSEAPVIIDVKDKRGKTIVDKPQRTRKKFKWGKLIDFDWDKKTEIIRFCVTYLLVGLGFILASDILQLVKLNTTAGFMVLIGILSIIAAIVAPIMILYVQHEERETKRRLEERERRMNNGRHYH